MSPALALYPSLRPPNPQLVAYIRRVLDRVEAELRESESNSRSTS